MDIDIRGGGVAYRSNIFAFLVARKSSPPKAVVNPFDSKTNGLLPGPRLFNDVDSI